MTKLSITIRRITRRPVTSTVAQWLPLWAFGAALLAAAYLA